MSDPCMVVPEPFYFLLTGPITLPTAVQISIDLPAKWLQVNPGQANQAGTGTPAGLVWRIYKGRLLGTGKWQTGYSLAATNPYETGNFVAQALVPWNDMLDFVLEIDGIGTWGSGSKVELTINPFSV